MAGLQCPKYLWFLFNDPDKIQPTDIATQHRFDEGHQVGELAKLLFPDGISIPTDNFIGNINQTKNLLKQRRILFEPAFSIDNLYSRLDMLIPVDSDQWDIVEVKMSTEMKDEHIPDIAFQRFCCEKGGLTIRNSSIAFINNKFTRHGEIDPKQLFLVEDVTPRVNDSIAGIANQVKHMFDIISELKCPDVPVGIYCNDPNDCPVNFCRESVPDNTILALYYAGKKKYELFSQGIYFIKDIPAGYKLTKSQQIQQECERAGQTHIDKEAIKAFLDDLKYPVYYLDFVTFNPAIPMFDNSRPYQQIPFQFSLHVVETERAEPAHRSYLADGTGDPRPELLAELRNLLGDRGSIIVYNQTFEKKVLEQFGEAFPESGGWAKTVIDRIVDLYVPFRSFCYYNPRQKGSASLKEVLPAVTGKSYEGLPIAKGDDASLAFTKLLSNKITDIERQKIRKDLIQYCGLDTEGMIWIVERLRQDCA
jgi:hypothetical protein